MRCRRDSFCTILLSKVENKKKSHKCTWRLTALVIHCLYKIALVFCCVIHQTQKVCRKLMVSHSLRHALAWNGGTWQRQPLHTFWLESNSRKQQLMSKGVQNQNSTCWSVMITTVTILQWDYLLERLLTLSHSRLSRRRRVQWFQTARLPVLHSSCCTHTPHTGSLGQHTSSGKINFMSFLDITFSLCTFCSVAYDIRMTLTYHRNSTQFSSQGFSFLLSTICRWVLDLLT